MTDSDEFILELDEACIETTARRAHRTLGESLLEDGPAGSATARAYELLTTFLQQTDFQALRSTHPDLAGGQAVRVRLFRRRDGGIAWERLG